MVFKKQVALATFCHRADRGGETKVRCIATGIHEAFYVATSGRPGPVVVDVPKDVQFAKSKYSKPKNT